MVFAKRTRTTAKATFRKRARRAMVSKRVPRRMPFVPSVSVKRTFWGGIWQPATTATVDFWRYFQYTLGNMPDNGQYTNVFDQYKIRGIKVMFMPRYNGYSGENTTDTTLPGITNSSGVQMSLINDPYSTQSPTGTYTSTSYNLFAEAGHVRLNRGDRPFSIFTRPTIANTILSGNNQLIKAPWLQTSTNNTVHYCFHAFAHDHNFSGNFLGAQAWDIYVTYYVSFKGMR